MRLQWDEHDSKSSTYDYNTVNIRESAYDYNGINTKRPFDYYEITT